MKPKSILLFIGSVLALIALPFTANSQSTAISGTTSVNLDFAALESAASLQLSSAEGTADAATGFPVAFAITNETPFQYTPDPFAPVAGSIDHRGSVTFTIVGTTDTVTVGDFTIGFDAARAVGGNSGFFVQDNVSSLGILFDVVAPTTLTADMDGLFIDAELKVSPEFATFLSTNSLATTDLSGVTIGTAQVNASTSSIMIIQGRTSVNLNFDALETNASLAFSSVNNTTAPAGGFPAGFAITSETPFMFNFPFAPVGGSINHTGSVTFNITGTETLVEVGNFVIGYDMARATGDNSGFFVEDTISSLGILFDVAAPTTLEANPDQFFAAAALNVSPEFATYLSTNALATADLTGVEIGSAQIDGLSGGLFAMAETENEVINFSSRGFLSNALGSEFNLGFVITGSDPATVVIRVGGEGTLRSIYDEAFGGEGASVGAVDMVQDPRMELFDSNQVSLAVRDNLADEPMLSLISGTSLDPVSGSLPNGPNDSILIITLNPGTYTVQVLGADEDDNGVFISGIDIVEM